MVVKAFLLRITGLFTRPGFAGDAAGSGLGLHSARSVAAATALPTLLPKYLDLFRNLSF
jgi:hypothetical protein